MSGPGYGSWNWTLINVKVWHFINKKANNQKYFLNPPLDVNELQKVSEEKDIGVVIDSTLKFELHVAKKIKRQIEWFT